MKNYIISFLLMTILFSCSNREKVVDKDKLLGKDYRLFQATPAWSLAKAVWDEDLIQIQKLVKQKGNEVNYQEPKYGKTLLMLTILNEQYKSCEKLLELGADPNKHDRYDGSSAIIDAAAINGTSDDNTAFLNLLLKNGANPNDIEVGKRRNDNLGRATPLIKACSSINKIVSPLARVKILVEAGADINYIGEYYQSPLSCALLAENFDIIVYFLQRDINCKIPIFTRNEKIFYIQDVLREEVLPLDSKEYQQKLEIVKLLKQKGIDYKIVPIPDFIIKRVKKIYSKNWEDYLSKY